MFYLPLDRLMDYQVVVGWASPLATDRDDTGEAC